MLVDGVRYERHPVVRETPSDQGLWRFTLTTRAPPSSDRGRRIRTERDRPTSFRISNAFSLKSQYIYIYTRIKSIRSRTTSYLNNGRTRDLGVRHWFRGTPAREPRDRRRGLRTARADCMTVYHGVKICREAVSYTYYTWSSYTPNETGIKRWCSFGVTARSIKKIIRDIIVIINYY